MRASQHQELGRVVAAVSKAETELLGDPMNAHVGYTPDPTPALEKMVRAEGFANLRHFAAVVEKRTSARWAHFNLGVSS